MKCSEPPTEIAASSLEPTRKLRTRFAPRSVWTRPSRNPNEGAAIASIVDARVPPLIEAPFPVMK